jgi:FtsZ-binding cell division protein ZapB
MKLFKTENINMHEHFDFDLVLARSTNSVSFSYNNLTEQQAHAIEHAVRNHDHLVDDVNVLRSRIAELAPHAERAKSLQVEYSLIIKTVEKLKNINTQLKEEQINIIKALGPYHIEGQILSEEVEYVVKGALSRGFI